MILAPHEIEAESFRLIDEEFRRRQWTFAEEVLPLVKRVVHATGDVDLARELVFHPQAVPAGLEALCAGADLVTDVQMVAVGISRRLAEPLGVEVSCHLNDPEVVARARESGLTRAYHAMEKALSLPGEKVVVIGNAPTALLAVLDHLDRGGRPPALVIGVPVGFVGAAEYKERLASRDVPHITLRGTRGGTPVAVALTNALLKLACERCDCHDT